MYLTNCCNCNPCYEGYQQPKYRYEPYRYEPYRYEPYRYEPYPYEPYRYSAWWKPFTTPDFPYLSFKDFKVVGSKNDIRLLKNNETAKVAIYVNLGEWFNISFKGIQLNYVFKILFSNNEFKIKYKTSQNSTEELDLPIGQEETTKVELVYSFGSDNLKISFMNLLNDDIFIVNVVSVQQ